MRRRPASCPPLVWSVWSVCEGPILSGLCTPGTIASTRTIVLTWDWVDNAQVRLHPFMPNQGGPEGRVGVSLTDHVIIPCQLEKTLLGLRCPNRVPCLKQQLVVGKPQSIFTKKLNVKLIMKYYKYLVSVHSLYVYAI